MVNESTTTSVNTNICKRLYWLDGIKGLSCFFIFLHHFMLECFPATVYGTKETSKLFGIDTFLSTSPLGFFINGNFFVFLFILISGYVITYQTINMDVSKIGIFSFKRYLKLSIPLIFYCVIVTILYKFGINKDFFGCNITLFQALKNGLFSILFLGSSSFSGPFWMLKYIMLGGLFLSLLSATVHSKTEKSNKTLYMAIFFFFVCFVCKQYYFSTCLLGGILCLITNYYEYSLFLTKYKSLNYILLLLGIFFAGFPTAVVPENIYRFFYVNKFNSDNTYLYHETAAFLLLLAIYYMPKIQNLFERNVITYFSKYSFTFYIFHWYILKLFSFCRDYFFYGSNNYFLATLIYFFISFIITFIISLASQKFILNKISKSLLWYVNE